METTPDYNKEYKDYISAFTNIQKDLITDSGDIISRRIMEIEGYNFRVGQIIAELDMEFSDYYLSAKEADKFITDKKAEHIADLNIRVKYKVSLKHFVNMQKAYNSIIQSFKKRLKQLEWERLSLL